MRFDFEKRCGLLCKLDIRNDLKVCKVPLSYRIVCACYVSWLLIWEICLAQFYVSGGAVRDQTVEE